MIIHFSPCRWDQMLELVRQGDILIVNGDPLDFSAIPDGASLPASAIDSEWIAGDVHRLAGSVHVSIRLPHGPNPSPAVAFPSDIVDPADGLVAVPQHPEAQES